MPVRTAREAFYNGPHRAAFEKMAATEPFDVAAEYALLAYNEELPDTGGENPNVDWATYHKFVGARRALEILRSLYAKEEPPKTAKFKSLTAPQ